MADDREAKLSDLQVGVHKEMGEHIGWKYYTNCRPEWPTLQELSQRVWHGAWPEKCWGAVWLSDTIVRPKHCSEDIRASKIRVGKMRDAAGRKYISGHSPVYPMLYIAGCEYTGYVDANPNYTCEQGFHAYSTERKAEYFAT